LAHKRAARGEDPRRSVLKLVAGADGEWLQRDDKGQAWRAYHFIEGSEALDRAGFKRGELHRANPAKHDGNGDAQ